MPELPEVETTKASLTPLLGQTVSGITLFQPKLRWQMPSNLSDLIGYRLTHTERRAKYLILHFQKDNDQKTVKRLIIHLGMSGSLQQHEAGFEKRKHDHLIFEFVNDNTSELTQLHYHDPRRFGAVLWHDDYASKLFDHLGIEPLEDGFNGEYLYRLIHRLPDAKNTKDANANQSKSKSKSKPKLKPITRPIKAVIMEQPIVVGVGNIYATESLFLSRIHPSTPANELSIEQLDILAQHIKAVLQTSIEKGGSTLRDFTVASGKTGYFQQTLNVYGKHKAPCPVCQTPIDKVTIAGRASTFCPQCQKNKDSLATS